MRVSVIVPTFNRATLLSRALNSVYQQSMPADEVIVVDDGSTDNTAATVATQFPNTNFVSIPHQGVSAARNTGIRLAKSTWLAFLDSDDEWHKEKLMQQFARISNEPSASIVHCDEQWLRNGKPLSQKAYHKKSGGDLFAASLQRCLISPSAAVIKADLLKHVGVFDETLTACEDYDLWLRICAQESVTFVPEKLVTKYGGHADQLSKTVWGLDRFRIQSLRKIIAGDALNDKQRKLAITTLREKVAVFITGARKRGHLDEVARYTRMLSDINSQET